MKFIHSSRLPEKLCFEKYEDLYRWGPFVDWNLSGHEKIYFPFYIFACQFLWRKKVFTQRRKYSILNARFKNIIKNNLVITIFF